MRIVVAFATAATRLPINILMLSDVYFPRVNGVSTAIQTYSRELVCLGHSVTIVAPEYPVRTEHTDTEFEIIRLPSRKIFFDPEDRLICRSTLSAQAQKLAARHFDAIHVHTPFRAHQLGVRLARMTGWPIVESYHTYFEEYVSNYLPWLPKPLGRFGVRWFSRRLCAAVDHLVVPTAQMAAVLRGYAITTAASVIPTGIRCEDFRGGDATRFRTSHDIAKGRPLLLTVSRLAIEKNIDFLLAMTRVVVSHIPDLLFVIAGEGPDAERLKRRAHELGLVDHVRFVGNLDRRTELLDCYRAADLFVFASSTETQGLVLIEAMAVGTPIVSTAVMGTATVLEHARSARISNGEMDNFAAHVVQLLRSPDARSALSRNGPDDADAWSATRLTGKLIELYARLCPQVASHIATTGSRAVETD
ncbi:MAG: glycosyltransferase [Dokdonella sp.]